MRRVGEVTSQDALRTQVASSFPALVAVVAGEVGVDVDSVADLEVEDVLADGLDGSGDVETEDGRKGRQRHALCDHPAVGDVLGVGDDSAGGDADENVLGSGSRLVGRANLKGLTGFDETSDVHLNVEAEERTNSSSEQLRFKRSTR